MQHSSVRLGFIALAIVAIGAPTVFYAARWSPFRRAPRAAVNAPAPDPIALQRNGITDRLATCAKARTAKEKERCFVMERQKCDQESSEKTWCVQRTLVWKLSGTAATCGAERSVSGKRRCLKQLWRSEAIADRKALMVSDRQSVCATLSDQQDRDRCLLEAVQRSLRDGGTDRSLCQQIQDEDMRSDCND